METLPFLGQRCEKPDEEGRPARPIPKRQVTCAPGVPCGSDPLVAPHRGRNSPAHRTVPRPAPGGKSGERRRNSPSPILRQSHFRVGAGVIVRAPARGNLPAHPAPLSRLPIRRLPAQVSVDQSATEFIDRLTRLVGARRSSQGGDLIGVLRLAGSKFAKDAKRRHIEIPVHQRVPPEFKRHSARNASHAPESLGCPIYVEIYHTPCFRERGIIKGGRHNVVIALRDALPCANLGDLTKNIRRAL